MHVLKFILIILEVLLVFNLLIFVHELGHFLAARWRGLKIERFAIWFGRPIWKTKLNGVEYALGWIPAGGYVSLPQMATMEAIEGKGEQPVEQLPPISALDKIIVAFAGPLFSFGLAVVFAFVVWGVGKPEQGATQNSTTIGWVDPKGPAAKAGLRSGDRIIEIDGHEVTRFVSTGQDSITWRVITSEGTNLTVKYERGGQEHVASVIPIKPPNKWYERKSLRKIMISPSRPTVVAEVITNSPAAAAGLRPNDEIIALNGEKVWSPEAVVYEQWMQTNGIKPVTLTVKRGDERFDCVLTAEKPLKPADVSPIFGFALWSGQTDETLVHPKPFEQIRAACGQIVATLNAVLSRKSDIGVQQLGGAVMIIRVYTNFLESENGWRWVLWFSVVLNVNLALLNLLPFPVLDGGHITLAVVEMIRRRPVNPTLLQYVQTACAVVLIAFMLFIAFFDTGDWLRSARGDRNETIVFAPKQ